MAAENVDSGLVVAILTGVAAEFRERWNGQVGGEVDFWGKLAEKLSAADGGAAWSWRYPQGVVKGSIAPSARFGKAVLALAASLDDVPLQLARAERVWLWAAPGRIAPGAYIEGDSIICCNVGCAVVFVPNHPRRRQCYICAPVKGRTVCASQETP